MMTDTDDVVAPVSPLDRERIEQFLFREARLADESRYDEWETLLEPDMIYWVPAGNMTDPDPETSVSIIFDNRGRLSKRIAQLKTGLRLAQQPASPMRRLLSNFEIEASNDDEFAVSCNFGLFEYRIQATREMIVWSGRYQYRLRRRDDSFGMFFKRVDLTNASAPIPTLAFLI